MPSDSLVAILIGTRPEAIKLAPVVQAARAASMPIAVIGTGQHAEMVDQVLRLFAIELDEDLGLMRPGQSLDHVLAGTISGIGELLDQLRPGALVVQGDTSSALGAAIAAFHRQIPVAHVEAGLRSGDLRLPFPEEMNRRGISILARWHFAPTGLAADNLRREGVTDGVEVVGNTVVDALRAIVARDDPLPAELASFVDGHPLIVATAHRREAWDGGIASIARALGDVLDALPDHRLVFATHPNPVARAPVVSILGGRPDVLLPGPLPYAAFLGLLARARLAVSDSGGIQEEGPTLGVPVVVTREVTERREAVDAGAVVLAGVDRATIRDAAVRILGDPVVHAGMAGSGRELYGDGHAAERIVATLSAALTSG